MISRIDLTNFRAIGPGRTVLPLKPLTLLVGENGAGKSSILQAIALTAQSATEQPRLQDIVVQGTKWFGGEPKDVYYRHDPSLMLSVGLTTKVSPEWWSKNGLPDVAPWPGMPAWPPTEFSYNWSRQGDAPTAWSHHYELDGKRIWDWLGRLKREPHGWEAVQEASIATKDGNFLGPLRPLKPFERVLPEYMFMPAGALFHSEFPPQEPDSRRADIVASWNEQIAKIASEASRILAPLSSELRQALERVYLIEPLRGKELVVSEAGEARSTGRHGQDLLRLLSTLQVRRERPYERFRKWAAQFGLHSVESGVQADKLDLSALDLNGVAVRMTEFATGSFQGLLLAAQIILAPSQSVLLIEEPESNMHPAYEKELASLFAEGVQIGQQLVVTTHSEILVAAVASLVRLGTLHPDSVAVIELSRDDKGVSGREIPITTRGLAEWVRSFTKVEAALSREWSNGIPEEG